MVDDSFFDGLPDATLEGDTVTDNAAPEATPDNVSTDDSRNLSAPNSCPTCGETVVRAPGARGRTPKYHPECRPLKSASRQPVVRVSRADALAAEETEVALANLNGFMMRGVVMLSLVDPFDALVLKVNTPELLNNLRPILRRYSAVRREFLMVQTGGSIVGLLLTLATIALPILAHHNLIPSKKLSSVFLNIPNVLIAMQQAASDVESEEELTRHLIGRVHAKAEADRAEAQRRATAEAMSA